MVDTATQTQFDSDFDAIASAQAGGLRGTFSRLGTHIVMLESTIFFKSRRDAASTVVIRTTCKETQVCGSYDGKLTPDELLAGKSPTGTDDPHHNGELLVAIYKAKPDKESIERFNGNVKGFMEAAKASVSNLIEAAKKVAKNVQRAGGEGADAAAEEMTAFAEGEEARFASLGIDLSQEAKGTVSKAETKAILIDNVMQGIYVKMVSTRYQNKNKVNMNITGFQAMSVEDFVKVLTEE